MLSKNLLWVWVVVASLGFKIAPDARLPTSLFIVLCVGSLRLADPLQVIGVPPSMHCNASEDGADTYGEQRDGGHDVGQVTAERQMSEDARQKQ